MDWSDQRERIRRFLRDPDGLIWSDALLLRLYNSEQEQLHQTVGLLDQARIVRTPPMFDFAISHDWENVSATEGVGNSATTVK